MVLVAFGVAAIYMGVDGRATVRDSIKQEQIVFGAADDPAVAKYASQWAEEPLQTGTQARAFAQIMHEHALEALGGLPYAQMGRFVSADDPENLAGTSDETAALMDEQGNPVSNSARNTWVTATALSTALNVSYMAEQMALLGIVVGIALLLSGIGFIILALGGALRSRETETEVAASKTTPRPAKAGLVPQHRGEVHDERQGRGKAATNLRSGPDAARPTSPEYERESAIGAGARGDAR